MKKWAQISQCRKYRYRLTREWNSLLPKCIFIGLNPSTADHRKDDPTIRRCIAFATRWGFGGFYMLNLFAYRATDPKELKTAADPVGDVNDQYILSCLTWCNRVVACWGAKGSLYKRDTELMQHIRRMKKDLWCLGITNAGMPKHPLYLRADTELIRYRGGCGNEH